MERLAPVTSAAMVLAALACCLPLGLTGAAGLLAVAATLQAFQGWFLGGAALLLAVGAFQCFRGQRTCSRRGRRFSLVVLGLSAAVVLGVLAFPQHVAAVIADGEVLSGRTATPAPLVEMSDAAALKARFNEAAGNTRVILLLAPSCPICLQGAAAIERVLEGQAGKPITVFAVWDRILPTDWKKPGARVRSRLNDPRVEHFWNPSHGVARELRRLSEAAKMQPDCCEKNGVWWDIAAVFPAGVRWDDALPPPILVDGTIVDRAEKVEAALRGR